MPDTEMTSMRLPVEVVAALRKHAEERGETLTETLRRAALMVLGKCPTCGQATPNSAETATAAEKEEANHE